jgi:hypothetical protein
MRRGREGLALRLLSSLAPLYLWSLLLFHAVRVVQLERAAELAVLLSLAARLLYVLLDSARRHMLSDAFLLCTVEVLLGVALVAPSMLGLRAAWSPLGIKLFLAWFGAALLLMPLADIFSLYFIPAEPLGPGLLLLPRFGVQLFYLTGLVAFMRGSGPLSLDALLPSLYTAANGIPAPASLVEQDPLYLSLVAASLLSLYLYCLRAPGEGGPALRAHALVLSLPSALLALLLAALAADAPLGASGSLLLATASLSVAAWLLWHE